MKKAQQIPQQKQSSGFATASLVLGIIALFPGWGILFGILAIIFGIIAIKNSRKGKVQGKKLAIAGTILGGIGILISSIMFGVFTYFMFGTNGNFGPITQVKSQASQQILTQNAGALELYKKKYGNYPKNLDVLMKAGYSVFPTDHFLKPLYYNVSQDGQSYELKSPGPDGVTNTSDDVLLPQ